MFPILGLQMGDETGQHPRDFFVSIGQFDALAFRDVLPIACDHELRARFAGGASRAVQILCEVPVS